MKLCFSTLVCPTWSLPQIVGAAAAHGLDGFDPRGIGAEIDITKLDIFDVDLEATLELLRRHNLRMPCLNTSIALMTPAPDRWQMMLDECLRYASLARRTASPYLRIFGGEIPHDMTREESLAMAHRHLRQLVKIASPHHCRVIIETHDDWSTGQQMKALAGDFAESDVGVLWDIEHSFRKGEQPPGTVQALGGRIVHVHIKDSVRRRGKNVPRLLGKGDLPLAEAIAALKSIGYQGWICLETEKRWHPQEAPDPEESLPQFVKYMRAKW